MKENIASIILWHEQTFPDATLKGQLEKFEDERFEYEENKCMEELADMFIVACGIARFDYVEALRAFWIVERILRRWTKMPVSRYVLQAAVDNKMAINRNRKWGKVGNKFQHIEEGEEE